MRKVLSGSTWREKILDFPEWVTTARYVAPMAGTFLCILKNFLPGVIFKIQVSLLEMSVIQSTITLWWTFQRTTYSSSIVKHR